MKYEVEFNLIKNVKRTIEAESVHDAIEKIRAFKDVSQLTDLGFDKVDIVDVELKTDNQRKFSYADELEKVLEKYPTLKDDLERTPNVECYKYNENWKGNRYHTDAISGYMEWNELLQTGKTIIDWELMDEMEYNESILANASNNFTDFFDKGDLVLVILYGDAEEE